MESQYKRDISQVFLLPLKDYRGFSWLANMEQAELAIQLSNEYVIPSGVFIHYIMYVKHAIFSASTYDMLLKYPSLSSDISKIDDFEREPEPIISIAFLCQNKTLTLTNPHIISKLYEFLKKYYQDQSPPKTNIKKRPSEKIIKFIATEVYNELRTFGKIEKWKSICITGYIFGLYNIGIKKDVYIKNQEQYKLYREERAKKMIKEPTYKTYVYGLMKRYINN